MKRSEVIVKMCRYYHLKAYELEQGSMRELDFFTNILELAEDLGMLPPFVDKDKDEYYEDGNWIDLHVENAVYAGQCKWEKE